MMKQKGLQCHPTKTVCIIIGNKKYREEAEKEIKEDPVMFGDFRMNFVESEVYLGDVISSQGLEDSVKLTIEKRSSKVNGAMHEAKAIMEDFRMQAMGGMAGAWDLWETAIVPSLLANCGSWVGIGKQTYHSLNELQLKYLRLIYSCPPSTPLLALRTQAGMMDMENRIAMEKVCLVARIMHTNKEKENLCREVLQVQLAMGWPGIMKEVKEICRAVGLEDVTIKYIHRDKVKEYIQYFDMKCAKEKMEPLEKCRLIRREDCRFVKSYMFEKSLEQSRLEFIWQTQMLDTRTTMKGKYQKNNYTCPHCVEGREQGVLESPVHLLEDCSAYSDLRVGLSPAEVLEDRARFLRAAIARRMKLEDKLKTTV